MKGCSCSCGFGTNASTQALDSQRMTMHGTQRPSGTIGFQWTDPVTIKSCAMPHRCGLNFPEKSVPCIDIYNKHRPQSSFSELKAPSQTTYTRVPLSSSSRNRGPTEVYKLAFDNDRVLCPYLYETYKYSLHDMANRKIETLTRGLVPVSMMFDEERPTGSHAPVRIRYHA